MEKRFREPISGFTHLFGAIVSIIGLIALIIKEHSTTNNTISLLAVSIFGMSLILLYSASTIYHLIVSSDKVIRIFKKLDHSMIFILIAGTYTPVCLIALDSYWRWGLLLLIWTFSLLGIIFKLFWVDCPKWLSSIMYVLLGWVSVFAISPLSKTVPANGLYLLVIGGVLYTVGAVIYCLEKANKKRTFGAHEIFHIFVLLGSLAHYLFIFEFLV